MTSYHVNSLIRFIISCLPLPLFSGALVWHGQCVYNMDIKDSIPNLDLAKFQGVLTGKVYTFSKAGFEEKEMSPREAYNTFMDKVNVLKSIGYKVLTEQHLAFYSTAWLQSDDGDRIVISVELPNNTPEL